MANVRLARLVLYDVYRIRRASVNAVPRVVMPHIPATENARQAVAKTDEDAGDRCRRRVSGVPRLQHKYRTHLRRYTRVGLQGMRRCRRGSPRCTRTPLVERQAGTDVIETLPKLQEHVPLIHEHMQLVERQPTACGSVAVTSRLTPWSLQVASRGQERDGSAARQLRPLCCLLDRQSAELCVTHVVA
ncbi:hypothetical protein EXIGLDRAFT_277945 [Exidia glandulosa HHB12029]|uniref:Uncharacterized protein n=1 Tax=Exidia glandulosa HHB12029 TaxID=1314781 RepID=A0A165M9A9_EXIGL|nr:hypothetical protein EXIGLDRAFT_277945 [Exidia glandulosa HHB12029]